MTKNRLISGLFLIGFGALTAAGGARYGIGNFQTPDAGMYPVMLGLALAFIGLFVLVLPDGPRRGIVETSTPLREVIQKHLRAWVAGVGGLILFVVLGKYGGLIPASFGLVFCAALGDSRNSLKASALLATGATIATVLIFHYGFHMQFPLLTFLD